MSYAKSNNQLKYQKSTACGDYLYAQEFLIALQKFTKNNHILHKQESTFQKRKEKKCIRVIARTTDAL